MTWPSVDAVGSALAEGDHLVPTVYYSYVMSTMQGYSHFLDRVGCCARCLMHVVGVLNKVQYNWYAATQLPR